MRTLFRTWLRTFVVQASWNYDRMIGVGSAYASIPLLRGLPKERHRAAMVRATQFFNAHPYMAGMEVGAVARAEYEGLPGEQIRRMRHALIGPLGSVGDRLIWAGVLPAAMGVGLTVTVFVSPVVGALTFLVLYNLAHFTVRAWALRAGWSGGHSVARQLTARGVQIGLKLLGPIAAFSVGLALPVVADWLAADFQTRLRFSIASVAVLGVGGGCGSGRADHDDSKPARTPRAARGGAREVGGAVPVGDLDWEGRHVGERQEHPRGDDPCG
jgi:mannose/fructose/N-acetylgalactosamine-specific phosphotransferase system component IID